MSAQPRSDSGAKRWPKLVACAAAMLAIANLQYGWTLFTTPLIESLGANLAAVQLASTLFVVTQTGLFPINAYLVERSSARIVVSVASLLVGVGWVGAGLANSLTALYVVYALGGIGAGAVYSACIGIAMKWFPDRRGLCVGVVAGSYGFGTALTNIPISRMIEGGGYRSAFIIFGLIQGVIVLIAAQFLSMPPHGWEPAGWEATKAKVQKKVQQSSRDYTPREMLRSRTFYVLYLMMSLVTFSGLMVTFQLKPIGESYGYDSYLVFDGVTLFGVTIFKGLTALNLTITLNNVLNGSARPFFGWVSDHLGRYDTMAGVFVMEAVAITALTLLVHHPIWFIILSGLTFFAWGDIYSLFPAAIADLFGSKHATTNYGIQYTAKGVGSIAAGPFAAMLMIAAGSWLPVLTAAVICNIAAAALAVFWLKPLVTRLMKEQSARSEASTETAPTPVDKNPAVSEVNSATAD